MRRPSRPSRLLAALAALAALATALPTGSALAGSPPTLSVNAPIGTAGLYGDLDPGTADQLILTHRRADATLFALDRATPPSTSWLLHCPRPVNPRNHLTYCSGCNKNLNTIDRIITLG